MIVRVDRRHAVEVRLDAMEGVGSLDVERIGPTYHGEEDKEVKSVFHEQFRTELATF
jgi:hypothetical protein